MDELIKQLSSPGWWLSVVVAGIGINLASAYLKPLVDRVLGRTSGWWAARLDAASTARNQWIEALRADEHEQVMAGLSELTWRIRSVWFVAFSSIFFVLGGVVQNYVDFYRSDIAVLASYAMGTVALFYGYLFVIRAARIRRDLHAARHEAPER